MRLLVLVLPLVLALACKSDPGDEAGESSGSSTGECGPADAAAVDPNYPPCDCDYTCDKGAMCRFSQGSSICLPACTPGPSCGSPDEPCEDSDCPTLAGVMPLCDGGRCVLGCSNTKPCPTGYACGDNNACEVEL